MLAERKKEMIDCIKRINNIGFQKSSYLGKEPQIPNYDILYIEENPLYGKDKTGEYVRDNFGWFVKKDDMYRVRYDENCFKNKETCFVLATFCYDEHEPCWELKTVANRPIGLQTKEITDFWAIMCFGFKYLEKIEIDND